MKRILSILLALLLTVGGLPAIAAGAEISVPQITAPKPTTSGSVVRYAPLAEGKQVYTDLSEAAAAIREQMKARKDVVSVTIRTEHAWSAIYHELVELAYAHTGVPTEGDYLRAQIGGYAFQEESVYDGEAYQRTFTYSFRYYSTAQQERELDAAVDAMLAQLGLEERDDYGKCKAIYDWMCDSITYDYTNLNNAAYDRKFSAYAAMMDRTAVCNGYAALLYRLLLEAGVENRYISGTAGDGAHAWNIVKLGDRYYYCDSTWDSGRSAYRYFLTGSQAFLSDHTDGEAYSAPGFRAAHPVSDAAYAPGASGSEGLYWSLDAGVLTITGMGRLPSFRQGEQPWAEYLPNIKKVVLAPGVMAIGANCFRDCGALREVSLPEGLTSIGDYAFSGCAALAAVTVPDTVTAIGEMAFQGCTGLERINLSEGLREIGRLAFHGCGKLRQLTLPGTLSAIGAFAFQDCCSLRELVIPGGVTKLSAGTFCGCASLEKVTLPDSLREMEGCAFYGCAALKRLRLPYGVTAVKDLLFYGCESLESALLPDTITEIGQFAFFDCGALSEITIPGGVTAIGGSAFYNCKSLKRLYVPETVTELGSYAFCGCGALTSLTLPAGLREIGDGTFFGCESLTGLYLPAKLERIGSSVFCSCKGLTELTIPQGVTAIGDHVFWGCDNLLTVRFTGSAPRFTGESFLFSEFTGFYPAGDTGWDGALQSYGGRVSWEPYQITCAHGETFLVNVKEPECTVEGYTGDSVCVHCNQTVQPGTVLDALGHSWSGETLLPVPGEEDVEQRSRTCLRCGRCETRQLRVTRLFGENRFETAFAVADALKARLGVERFGTVILASGTNFPDALSGTYLAAVKQAPILLSYNETYNSMAKDYIRENLIPGGTIYLLGSEGAVPESLRAGLEDFHIKRLGGGNRFETNLEILREAGVAGKEILVCTGTGFADSLSASAAGLPILLVHDSLYEDQRAFLEECCRGSSYTVIGSEGAVSSGVMAEISCYGIVRRIGGGNRFETSVRIAEEFFPDARSAVLAYAWNYPDGLCGGGLAAAMDAPLILTMEGYEAQAEGYARSRGITKGSVLGSGALIPDGSVRLIFALGQDMAVGEGH